MPAGCAVSAEKLTGRRTGGEPDSQRDGTTDVEQTRRLTLPCQNVILATVLRIPHVTLALDQSPSDRAAELAGWLLRTALGDRAAFAALYRATSAHLFGVILRINRDRSQAEELLQDIYVNIWRAAGGFDAARAQPMTWLVSIARNRAIDSLRRAKSDVKTVSRSAPGAEGEDDSDLLAALPSDDAGPLQLLERAVDARALTHCVRQLSAEQQQCVALAYYQGLSHAEVAEHLVQPLGTVKSWVRRALSALKSCLARAAQASEAAAQSPARGA